MICDFWYMIYIYIWYMMCVYIIILWSWHINYQWWETMTRNHQELGRWLQVPQQFASQLLGAMPQPGSSAQGAAAMYRPMGHKMMSVNLGRSWIDDQAPLPSHHQFTLPLHSSSAFRAFGILQQALYLILWRFRAQAEWLARCGDFDRMHWMLESVPPIPGLYTFGVSLDALVASQGSLNFLGTPFGCYTKAKAGENNFHRAADWQLGEPKFPALWLLYKGESLRKQFS
jgi:hypothetical protein